MSDSSVVHSRLEELKRSFDQSFAEAPWRETEQVESFLSIRVGSHAYAVLLSQAAGLYVDRKVVGLPGPVTELLGLAGFRGTVIPVFDLGACLGYGLSSETGRWMLLVGKNEPIGLAFQEFDGYLRTPHKPEQQGSVEEIREHVSDVVVVGGIIRPVINLVSVVQALKRRVASVGSSEGA